MRIIKPIPPAKVMSALQAGLTDFVDPGDQNAASLGQHYEAHQVFTLGLDQFSGAGGMPVDLTTLLNQAKPAGWRFMALGATSDLGCHVADADQNADSRFIGLTRTPALRYMLERLNELEGRTHNPSGEWANMEQDYELRALRIPGLLIEALWLHRDNPRDDRLVYFAGFFRNSGGPASTWRREPMVPYTAEVFFGEIKDAAVARFAKHKAVYEGGQDIGNSQR